MKGFTLIEIIVVLIILGVIAAIALPAYFSWIQRSRAAEAWMIIGDFKNQFGACLIAHDGDPNFDANTCRGIYLNFDPGPNFHFLGEPIVTGLITHHAASWQVTLVRNPANGFIDMTFFDNGSSACLSGGELTGAC